MRRQPGCSPQCTYGDVVCAGGPEKCFKDIPSLSHGFPEIVPPAGPGESPYFDDVTLACTATHVSDSASGTVCGVTMNAHAPSADVAIYTMRNLTVTGSVGYVGSRRVVFAVYGDVHIASSGALHVDASASTPGSGAFSCFGGDGGGGNEAGTTDQGGTGGGGGGGGAGRISVDLYDAAACSGIARTRISPQPDCQ